MSTDSLSAEPEQLGARMASSARWVTAATLTGSATTWLGAVALSRVLERHEFGLAALAMLAVAVFQLFQDSGLHAALIQRREGIRAAADSAALYAPLAGLALAVLCIAVAPLAARFFHQHEVASLVRGLAAVFVLRSLAIVPSALIQRELLFARKSVISIAGSLLYLGAAIGLALEGAGAWAVIGAQLAVAAWSAAASWVATPYRPDPRRASVGELRSLLGYGRHIVAGNVVGFVNSNTDPTAVGRLYGPVPLGAYTLGFQTGSQAVTVVTGIANVLVFPAYAKLQGDLARFRRAYLRSLRVISVVSPPIAFGLAAISDLVIPTLYGSRWSAATPVLAVIAFYGLFLSISATTGEVFKAAGRPDLFFKMGVYQVVFLVGLIAAFHSFGIVGFAGARAGATLVMSVVALVVAARILGLSLGEWGRAIREPLVAALVMGATVVPLKMALAHAYGASAWQLAPLVLGGIVVYSVALRCLAPARWREFSGELRRILPVGGAFRLLRLRRHAWPVARAALVDGRADLDSPVRTLGRKSARVAGAERPEVHTR